MLPCSETMWMAPRGGSVNCTACQDTVPCVNNYLTFGANDNMHRNQKVTRIAITQSFPLEELLEDNDNSSILEDPLPSSYVTPTMAEPSSAIPPPLTTAPSNDVILEALLRAGFTIKKKVIVCAYACRPQRQQILLSHSILQISDNPMLEEIKETVSSTNVNSLYMHALIL